jgi:hypothetical protein
MDQQFSFEMQNATNSNPYASSTEDPYSWLNEDITSYGLAHELTSLELQEPDPQFQMTEASNNIAASSSGSYNYPISGDEGSKPSSSCESSYRCQHNACSCDRTFKRRSELQKHIHRVTRPFACSEPNCTIKPFSTRHDLKRHQREVHVHDGSGRRVSKFRCPVTGCKRQREGFGRKGNLATHMSKIHPERAQANHYFADMSSAASASSPEESCNANIAAYSLLSPALAASSSLLPNVTTAASESQLQLGLVEKLKALQANRDLLANQLSAIDEQMDAMRKVIGGLAAQGDSLSCV